MFILKKFLQTYFGFIFLIAASISCVKSPDYIAIQPYGSVSQAVIDSVSSGLARIYGSTIVVLDEIDLPESAFVNIKSPRYRADSLLAHLKRIKPNDVDYIVGLASSDISTTKRDRKGNIKSPKSKYQDQRAGIYNPLRQF